MRAALRYTLSFVLVFAAAALSFIFVVPQLTTWYTTLTLPGFTPPSWLFEPVWIILCFFMAIALARVWGCKENAERRQWLLIFGPQLLLNVLWSFFFFALHSIFLSVLDILVLWFTLAVLTLKSYNIDRVSFWFLIPCFAWVTFATILNVGIWWIH